MSIGVRLTGDPDELAELIRTLAENPRYELTAQRLQHHRRTGRARSYARLEYGPRLTAEQEPACRREVRDGPGATGSRR